MKNYLILIFLILWTSSLSAQLFQVVEDTDTEIYGIFSNSKLEITIQPITSYWSPQAFKLKLSQGYQDDRIHKIHFYLKLGNSENPYNDFRWTANQLYQELAEVLIADNYGVLHFFENVNVIPQNTLDNDAKDTSFSISFTVNHFDGMEERPGFAPPSPVQVKSSGRGDIETEIDVGRGDPTDGCGNCGGGFVDTNATNENGDEGTLPDDDDDGEGDVCFPGTGGRLSAQNFNTHLYPNPTTGQIEISVNAEVRSMQIFDANSRLVAEYSPESYILIDMSSFPVGIYQLHTTFKSGSVQTDKIVLIR